MLGMSSLRCCMKTLTQGSAVLVNTNGPLEAPLLRWKRVLEYIAPATLVPGHPNYSCSFQITVSLDLFRDFAHNGRNIGRVCLRELDMPLLKIWQASGMGK